MSDTSSPTFGPPAAAPSPPRASLLDGFRDSAARTALRWARSLSEKARASALSTTDPHGPPAGAGKASGADAPPPRFPATHLLLLAAAERVDDARGDMGRIAANAAEETARGRRAARRLASVLAAAERPRLTEVALRHLPDLPEHYTASLGGAVAARKARLMFEQGRLSDAIDAVEPYTGGHEVCARMHDRLLGERRALGPLPEPPARDDAGFEPVPGRVLHVVSNALPYTGAGYTVRTHRIVTAQKDAGLEPSVVTFPGWPLDRPGVEESAELDGVGHHRLHPGVELPGGLAAQIEAGVDGVAALARRLRPAVLHAATDHRNGSIAAAAAARLGLPFVYEVRGFREESWLSGAVPQAQGSERHRAVVERESALMRTADAVVTLSETMREEIVARGADPARIVLAPNAVEPWLLDARPDGAGFRREHGLEDDDFVVGSVSSVVGYEGFTVLAEAVALLRGRGVPARMLLVGDGEALGGVRAAVRRLGIGEACVLPGRVDPADALRAHAALDAFAAPRADDRVCRLVTPLKPVEAMALGTPVVASDLPALRELLGGGGAGLMVEPGDAEALADALERLHGDPGLRSELSAAGREEVTANRTWPRVAEVYRGLYARLGAV
ncbi:glycosyltransferase [Nocardiopsis suaedae]|uniref:Glycosyltransferase n=1 Tax=Nocardiopsis suaedae TaxID=3018444 RepID=A0ABT4TS30_9ACTN|nr:glycosyltransferase [Nocardiopsis suaedae]MDA2807201.1 glycosyltransferase [Nocardiopsis suaedae]